MFKSKIDAGKELTVFLGANVSNTALRRGACVSEGGGSGEGLPCALWQSDGLPTPWESGAQGGQAGSHEHGSDSILPWRQPLVYTCAFLRLSSVL